MNYESMVEAVTARYRRPIAWQGSQNRHSAEVIAEIGQLWQKGYSATIVSEKTERSKLTRNAVVGIIHRWRERLGLDSRDKVSRKGHVAAGLAKAHPNGFPRKRGRRAESWSAWMKKPRQLTKPVEPIVVEKSPTPTNFAEMAGTRTCKWPYGDVGTEGFHFCGAKRESGHSYCAPHELKAFNPGRVARPR